jgi:M-phase inducer tyrosine phosphatase
MLLNCIMRQSKIEEFFHQAKPGKSEAVLLPKLESSVGENLISVNTVAFLVKGEFSFDKFIILDCRFDYEYEGGHIAQAKHADSKSQILELLEGRNWDNIPIIIHCEFSQFRGPTFLKWLRNYDRIQNMDRYPNLSYPELYLMQGGYSEFYRIHPELCFPKAYVPCNLKKSKKELNKIKKTIKLLI